MRSETRIPTTIQERLSIPLSGFTVRRESEAEYGRLLRHLAGLDAGNNPGVYGENSQMLTVRGQKHCMRRCFVQ